MTDQALKNAEARMQALRQEALALAKQINELGVIWDKRQVEIEEVDGFIKMWHQMAGTEPPPAPEQNKALAPIEAARRIRPKNPDRQDVAIRCVNYIREARHPLMRKELMDMLQADGIEISGKDPLMVLSTMLWRSKDSIRRLKAGGYWPVADPVTPDVSQDMEDIMS